VLLFALNLFRSSEFVFLAPKLWEPERKIGFFPPIDTAKPIKDILESGLEKGKVKMSLLLLMK